MENTTDMCAIGKYNETRLAKDKKSLSKKKKKGVNANKIYMWFKCFLTLNALNVSVGLKGLSVLS